MSCPCASFNLWESGRAWLSDVWHRLELLAASCLPASSSAVSDLLWISSGLCFVAHHVPRHTVGFLVCCISKLTIAPLSEPLNTFVPRLRPYPDVAATSFVFQNVSLGPSLASSPFSPPQPWVPWSWRVRLPWPIGTTLRPQRQFCPALYLGIHAGTDVLLLLS